MTQQPAPLDSGKSIVTALQSIAFSTDVYGWSANATAQIRAALDDAVDLERRFLQNEGLSDAERQQLSLLVIAIAGASLDMLRRLLNASERAHEGRKDDVRAH